MPKTQGENREVDVEQLGGMDTRELLEIHHELFGEERAVPMVNDLNTDAQFMELDRAAFRSLCGIARYSAFSERIQEMADDNRKAAEEYQADMEALLRKAEALLRKAEALLRKAEAK